MSNPSELEQAVLFLLDAAQGITCPDDVEAALYQSTRLLKVIQRRIQVEVDNGTSGAS